MSTAEEVCTEHVYVVFYSAYSWIEEIAHHTITTQFSLQRICHICKTIRNADPHVGKTFGAFDAHNEGQDDLMREWPSVALLYTRSLRVTVWGRRESGRMDVSASLLNEVGSKVGEGPGVEGVNVYSTKSTVRWCSWLSRLSHIARVRGDPGSNGRKLWRTGGLRFEPGSNHF